MSVVDMVYSLTPAALLWEDDWGVVDDDDDEDDEKNSNKLKHGEQRNTDVYW